MSFQSKTRHVAIHDLLLDPNNPRIVHHPREHVEKSRVGAKQIQEDTFKKMLRFDIPSLEGSILSKGWYPVSVPIYIESWRDGKYIVIEGNRRITTLKSLFLKHELKKISLRPELLMDLEAIECKDISDASDAERENLRGMIHQGGSLAWSLLSQAADIYRAYMGQLGTADNEKYEYSIKEAQTVADGYNLRLSEVRDRLAAFRVYLAIIDRIGFDDIRIVSLEKKFSILYEAMRSKIMRGRLQYALARGEMPDAELDWLIRVVLGTARRSPVVQEASAGTHNFRDFLFVLKKSPKDLDRMVEEGLPPSEVKMDVEGHLADEGPERILERIDRYVDRLRVVAFVGGVPAKVLRMLDKFERVIDGIRKHKIRG